MDIGRVGSLYIHGLENFTSSGEMTAVLAFQRQVDRNRLSESFESLIRTNRTLQLTLQRNRTGFHWIPAASDELEATLRQQREWFQSSWDWKSIAALPADLNYKIPIRVFPFHDSLVLQMNHTVGNGSNALYWIEKLLAAYTGESASVVPLRQRYGLASPIRRALQMGMLIPYLAQFAYRAGSAAQETVDLSRGRTPQSGCRSYSFKTYRFTAEETHNILLRCKAAGISLTQFAAKSFCLALWRLQPDKSRVCISIPTDLGGPLGKDPGEPGNYTGGLLIQARRDGDLAAQLHSEFGWLRHNVDYLLPQSMAWLSGNEEKLAARFVRSAAKPIPQRAPFENLSCAISNLGIVGYGLISKHLAGLSMHMRTQTILACLLTLNHCLFMDVTAPTDLFDEQEVFAVSDALAVALSGR